MRIAAICKITGLLLMLFSLCMLPPIFIALLYGDSNTQAFSMSFILTLLVGAGLWLPFHHHRPDLKNRDGFLVVTLIWVVLSLFGALPFYFYFFPHLSITNALFESVSGLTTTGGSVFSQIETMPHAIIYYHQQLHLLGGMGIILLAVAILPILGVGGMQLYRAETTGPVKTEKLRPRITQTAKALWYIYLGLVVLCALSYWAAGMSVFNAIGESFSTVATGGFTMHSNSFAYYHSHIINSIAITFMLLGSINFGLHYQFIRHRNLNVYFNDIECRTYIKILFIMIVICGVVLTMYHSYNLDDALLQSLFTVVSMGSTTGFTISNFSQWPSCLPYLLMFITMIGGCGASAAGGIKVMRFVLLQKQGALELKRLVHPQGVFSLKLGGQLLPENIIQSVWGFIAVFIALFIILFLLLYATGLDAPTSFSALAACMSNAGTGIGAVALNFAGINTLSKWILIFAMLVGRLEIFTLLVLFTPNYWRE